jgi:flavin reductase (DIM6/NTAB) family NADH-FMN oxidoreductase RutF
MHVQSQPSILYFGTPVVLISTINENGSFNLAPISSAFWLGWRCVIGIGKGLKTTENLIRTRECVLNLPSIHQAQAVDALALTTGSNPVPPGKAKKGYRYEADKFAIANLTPLKSKLVSAPAVKECPVHLEAVVTSINPLAEDEEDLKNRIVTMELKIISIQIEESILKNGDPHYVDPEKWRPLIMSFQHYYGLGTRLRDSKLAEIPEKLYQMKPVDVATG